MNFDLDEEKCILFRKWISYKNADSILILLSECLIAIFLIIFLMLITDVIFDVNLTESIKAEKQINISLFIYFFFGGVIGALTIVLAFNFLQ